MKYSMVGSNEPNFNLIDQLIGRVKGMGKRPCLA